MATKARHVDRVWWKLHPSKPMKRASQLLSLPAELRIMVYDLVAAEYIFTVRNGKLLLPALGQTNCQLHNEFGRIFQRAVAAKRYPGHIRLEVQDFDFSETVAFLRRWEDFDEARFDIRIRVTRQVQTSDWNNLWPWVELCDESVPRERSSTSNIITTYTVYSQLRSCNPYVAAQDLYTEAMPYFLRCSAGTGQVSAGYEEISKIRQALGRAVG